jgi:hypothetical protein
MLNVPPSLDLYVREVEQLYGCQRRSYVKRRIQKGFLDPLNGNVGHALCLATYDWASSSCSPVPAAEKIDYARLAKAVQRKPKVSRALAHP